MFLPVWKVSFYQVLIDSFKALGNSKQYVVACKLVQSIIVNGLAVTYLHLYHYRMFDHIVCFIFALLFSAITVISKGAFYTTFTQLSTQPHFSLPFFLCFTTLLLYFKTFPFFLIWLHFHLNTFLRPQILCHALPADCGEGIWKPLENWGVKPAIMLWFSCLWTSTKHLSVVGRIASACW